MDRQKRKGKEQVKKRHFLIIMPEEAKQLVTSSINMFIVAFFISIIISTIILVDMLTKNFSDLTIILIIAAIIFVVGIFSTLYYLVNAKNKHEDW